MEPLATSQVIGRKTCPEALLVAEQGHFQVRTVVDRLHRPGHKHIRSLIAAHGIQGNMHRHRITLTLPRQG